MTIIWCIVLEIWRATDRIFCHFGLFCSFIPKIMIIYYTFPEIWQMADVKLIFILGYFLHFYPINRLKNQTFLKVKKKHLEISSSYISVPTIMIICYTVPEIWCMMDVIIFHFRLFFALLPHYLPKKPIFFQKCQKQLEIPSFYTHVPKLMIRWCMVPEIWCTTDRKSDMYRCGCPI